MVRAGRLIKFIPYQVVSGYLSGVAVIIALGQLPKLLGLPKDVFPRARAARATTLELDRDRGRHRNDRCDDSGARFTQKIPAAILGMLAGIATYFALALFDADLLRLHGNPL